MCLGFKPGKAKVPGKEKVLGSEKVLCSEKVLGTVQVLDFFNCHSSALGIIPNGLRISLK